MINLFKQELGEIQSFFKNNYKGSGYPMHVDTFSCSGNLPTDRLIFGGKLPGILCNSSDFYHFNCFEKESS